MMKITDRTKGLLIMMSGVLVISPDAVLTRYLSEGGASPWTIIFWKMIFAIPVSMGFAVYDAGGISKLIQQVVDGRKYYPIVIPLQAAVDACFTLSFVYTSAANALLLINLNPLWCALAGRLLLGDILPTRTYIALVLALGCTLIIFVPELVDSRNTHSTDFGEGIEEVTEVELGQSAPLGNIISLLTGIGLAAYITLVRHGSMREKPVNLIGCTGFAATLAAIIALIVQRGDVLPSSYWKIGDDETSRMLWKFWLASLAQGSAVGVIFVCMTIAPRLITGAEVGLCVLTEAVLGPLFVFLAYGDIPSQWTIIGGSLLLTVLAFHEAAPLLVKATERSISLRLTKIQQRSTMIGDDLEDSKNQSYEAGEETG